jgi:N-acetylneuraminic acid mutarotase
LLSAEGRQKVLRESLTFAERVAYQRAIEEVFWRHRIWPRENLQPKPALDAVIPEIQLKEKVANYLRKSQLATERRGRPISMPELQAEMERMASHTRQPEILRELFAALRNDPFIIAECIARPILAERLVNDRKVFLNRQENMVSAVRPVGATSGSDNAVYTLPEISTLAGTADNSWASISDLNGPGVRDDWTSVWTGSEMIIWGGFDPSLLTLNTGARYSPSTDSWTSTSVAGAPLGRAGHTAVWTGGEMLVWGGANDEIHISLDDGSKYNPATDTWTAIATINAPVARSSHSAVWTGTEMMVWGGWGGHACNSNCMLGSGGRYNVEADTWNTISDLNAPTARWEHHAFWTGSEMIVWGGTDQSNYLHTGARYNPASDSWTPTSLTNVPPGRISFSAIWTGSEMIVWGGVDETFHQTNTGGRYNPVTDSWIATNLTNAPSLRDAHSAVWTGSEMIIWGGVSGSSDVNTGARYDPSTNSWSPTTMVNAPERRQEQSAEWSGHEMIIWGGKDIDNPNFYLDSGGEYNAQPSTPLLQSVVSRKSQSNVGNFDINLPMSGPAGIECRSGGATGDYTVIVTFLANVSINANPQATVTSGVATVGSGGASNGGAVIISGNVVTIPLTNVANAQTINVTLNNVNGSTNVTIPMRVLIGDVTGNGVVNASDVALTKAQSGQTMTATNFREDVTTNGLINAGDVSMVKSLTGTAVP